MKRKGIGRKPITYVKKEFRNANKI